MKILPIGIQTIKDIIDENYIYVDKTEYIYNLLVNRYYFLSRPRRFGKSLLISTMKEIFSGNKELFKNCWIYDKIPWEKHPVILLDFASITHSKGLDNFEKNLIGFIDDIAKKYNCSTSTVHNYLKKKVSMDASKSALKAWKKKKKNGRKKKEIE